MLYPLSFLLPLDINPNSQFSNPNCNYPIMANADVSSPSPEPQRSKRPPDMVVPPPPTPPVDGESLMDAIDGQEERKEEDCDLASPDLENKVPLHAGSDILSEGKAVCGDDSSFEKAILVEKPIGEDHFNKMEIVKEENDLPLVKLDTSTPEQPMGECQAVKSGSERKRKSHDGSKHIESLFDRRLTRSNSRIVTKGVNNCQKVAKRITRSQKSSPADYLGNDVDIAGIERALKRLSRTGSKRVLQEPAGDNGLLNSPCENTGDCIMSDLPYSDGSSDVVNKGVNIIEEIMETFQGTEMQPVCVEFPTQELVNMDHPSDELDGNNGSKEADETTRVINETDAVIPMEVSATAVEISISEVKLENSILDTPSKRLTRSALRNAQLELTEFSGFESSMHETKNAEQSIVLPVEECSRVVEVSTDENKLDSSKLVTPSKRLTRSAMKNEQLHAMSVPDFGSSRDEPILKNENMEEQKQVAEELVSCSVDESTDLVKIEKSGLDVPSKRLTRSALKNAQMDITPFLGFRSTIDEPISESPEAKKIEVAQVSIDGSSFSNTVKLGNAEFETFPKRVTRSAVKNAQMVSSELELPPRRFTRSQMKCSVSYDEEEDEDGDGVDVSEPERATRKVSCSSQKGNRPTMSGRCKKFDLVKPPSNARELLATGFLEGLDVMYIVPNSKKPVLKGMIKGGSILCFCSACKGYRSVSAYNFEVHAGSTKKHPSDFIFLENGNTLRDVLRVCSSARVSDLETSLRNEVGPVPRKNLRACLRCGSHLTPDVHRFFLCDSCSDSNQLLAPCDSTLSMSQSPFTIGRSPIPVPSQSTVEMLSRGVPSPTLSFSASAKRSNTVGRLTRKNIGLHKLVFTCDILPEGTEVAYYVGGKRLLDGYIKEGAIFCHCCSAVVSPSQFEAHAGQSSRRKPYNNIYTSNGVSLHELSVSLSKHKMVSQGETDDLCSICSDSGDLIICDFCPRAFHKDCVGLTEIPEGDWYCQFCVSLHRRDNCVASNDNARAAGRVEGVDPIEQIFKRCIRIVSISETDLGGCTICKLHDFSQSGFDDRTVILCDQCQREYHVGCLRDCKMADLKELPEGEWFCSLDCSIMHGALKEVILSGPQSLTSHDIELIKRKSEAKGASDNENENKEELVDYDNIRWRLLSGASAQEVEAQLLSGAVSIFHESFDPIIDAKSKVDLIPAMVNGMSIDGHQDYSGMYCAVITIGSKVVSAGLLRVFGTDAAELPLVATSRDLQGLGYFQALFGCMERMLIDLKVRHFLLPAAEEAESIWTKKFGFSRIPSDQVEEYLKGAHLTAFRGTASLHKPLFVS